MNRPTNSIITNTRNPKYVTTQYPLDIKLWAKNSQELIDLGTDDEKAFKYYKGMFAYNMENDKVYRWLLWDPLASVPGLLIDGFTYPNCYENDMYPYAGKTFNFVETTFGTPIILPYRLLKTATIGTLGMYQNLTDAMVSGYNKFYFLENYSITENFDNYSYTNYTFESQNDNIVITWNTLNTNTQNIIFKNINLNIEDCNFSKELVLNNTTIRFLNNGTIDIDNLIIDNCTITYETENVTFTSTTNNNIQSLSVNTLNSFTSNILHMNFRNGIINNLYLNLEHLNTVYASFIIFNDITITNIHKEGNLFNLITVIGETILNSGTLNSVGTNEGNLINIIVDTFVNSKPINNIENCIITNCISSITGYVSFPTAKYITNCEFTNVNDGTMITESFLSHTIFKNNFVLSTGTNVNINNCVFEKDFTLGNATDGCLVTNTIVKGIPLDLSTSTLKFETY